ncbi:hypothetical protein SapgrDRAFT_1185 [Saprospira grandis DSM 2844]|uniref:DUF4468 domain-containing protein n=1 Tax=Saprospira grandis DSM 2844 TaxID=694433 RepID=J0NZD3_9BACT|nr:hypothetical protein [Saprospira grandis]EJF52909.1 hypothetical protein SapgrDRAFT_1185 [Saprospira grandis DSM 2844]
MLKSLLSLLFLALPFWGLWAQDAPQDFIITISYDTLYGKVVGGFTPGKSSVMVKFKEAETGETKVYKAKDIKSWHAAGAPYYFESKVYQPKGRHKLDAGYAVFMRRLNPGKVKVKLYEYYNTEGSIGYTQTYLERKGSMEEVVFRRFRKQLAAYLADQPEIVAKIQQKEYKKRDLERLIADYNQAAK